MSRCLLCGFRPWLLGRARHDDVHRLLGLMAKLEIKEGRAPGWWRA